jgi:hypothetical protein
MDRPWEQSLATIITGPQVTFIGKMNYSKPAPEPVKPKDKAVE